eukprot:3435933-Rhodomonas_salina.1
MLPSDHQALSVKVAVRSAFAWEVQALSDHVPPPYPLESIPLSPDQHSLPVIVASSSISVRGGPALAVLVLRPVQLSSNVVRRVREWVQTRLPDAEQILLKSFVP